MKLLNYVRKLKNFIVLPKQFKLKGIKNTCCYLYHWKIFFNFLLFGLFKDEFEIKFGSDYWKRLPKYIFSLLVYFEDLIDYKLISWFFNKIKKENVGFLKPYKPLSPKVTAVHYPVNEFILEHVSKANGFEIVDERLYPTKTTYTLRLSSRKTDSR